MKYAKGNLWDWHKKGEWIAITTNGNIKHNGEAVMGRGVAQQAKSYFRCFPLLLAEHIRLKGNVPGIFYDYRMISFPVKHNWWEKADINLIEKSANFLVKELSSPNVERFINRIFMPRPGCGYGQLEWDNVKPILQPILDDRFIIVTFK